jgi:hypothetical protein
MALGLLVKISIISRLELVTVVDAHGHSIHDISCSANISPVRSRTKRLLRCSAGQLAFECSVGRAWLRLVTLFVWLYF